MKYPKLILTSGGKGTRVKELTGGVMPKGLSRISKDLPKPLIAYQLEIIAATGIKEVFVSLEEEWQKVLFQQSLRIGELPNLNYSIGIHKWEHPLNTFYEPNVLEFVNQDDFIWTYGDLYYSPNLLKNMIYLAQKNNTSAASMMHSDSARWQDGGKYITFKANKNNVITNYDLTAQPGFTLHAPFYFQNTALNSIKTELDEYPPHQLSLLKRLVDKGQLSAFHPDFLLNMNTSARLNDLVKELKKSKKF